MEINISTVPLNYQFGRQSRNFFLMISTNLITFQYKTQDILFTFISYFYLFFVKFTLPKRKSLVTKHGGANL